MARTSKTTEPPLIADAVPLRTLYLKTGILAVSGFDDPVVGMLTRYGLGDRIGIDYAGQPAVSTETASTFLTQYELTKSEHSAKVAAFKRYQQERAAKAAEKRAEQKAAAWAAKLERAEKAKVAARAEQERQKAKRLEAERAARAKADPGLSFKEFAKEWEKNEGRQ